MPEMCFQRTNQPRGRVGQTFCAVVAADAESDMHSFSIRASEDLY